MRQMYIEDKPDIVKGMCDIHARHRGAVDEWWTGGAFYHKKPLVTAAARSLAGYLPMMRDAGIAHGWQQGVTLGHDFSPTKADPDAVVFSNEAYQVDVDGNLTGFYCPTSPEVLAYEEWFMEEYVRKGKIVSVWLDDDLRMGFWKKRAAACFCPRCIKLLNEKCGTSFTREEWVKRLSSTDEREPLRAKWTEFKEESLAMYAAAARRGAKKGNPNVRMAYQSISSATITTGLDYRRILAALSDNFRDTVGIRPGHGYYTERGVLEELPVKLLDVARESERCRSYPGWNGTICYEQENYPHYVAQKNPEACVKEAALALAAGCDTVALYWYNGNIPEPLEYYEDMIRHVEEWRHYYECLSDLAKRTHLGGIAVKPDPDLAIGTDNNLPASLENKCIRHRDIEWKLMSAGVPVTIAESGTKAFIEANEEDFNPDYITNANWNALLNRLDAKTPGGLPVRLGKFAHLLVFPRVDDQNRTVAVTLCNMQIGRVDGMTIRIRRPSSETAKLIGPYSAEEQPLTCDKGFDDELIVHLSNLAPWEVCTIIMND